MKEEEGSHWLTLSTTDCKLGKFSTNSRKTREKLFHQGATFTSEKVITITRSHKTSPVQLHIMNQPINEDEVQIISQSRRNLQSKHTSLTQGSQQQASKPLQGTHQPKTKQIVRIVVVHTGHLKHVWPRAKPAITAKIKATSFRGA